MIVKRSPRHPQQNNTLLFENIYSRNLTIEMSTFSFGGKGDGMWFCLACHIDNNIGYYAIRSSDEIIISIQLSINNINLNTHCIE